MTAIVSAIRATDDPVLWLDGLSRAAAGVVIAMFFISFASLGVPGSITSVSLPATPAHAQRTLPELDEAWVWSKSTQNFDAMYIKR
ncbi:MAG: hypothetical protein CL917_12000 [Deltaproteobacteria bacterium]|nr:hypothetical protein [Deltaproteobacteria bacterium]